MNINDLDQEKLMNRSATKLMSLNLKFTNLVNAVLTETSYISNKGDFTSILVDILQRLGIGISAINYLLKRLPSNQFFRYPIAVQMRACIADSILVAYLIAVVGTDSKKKLDDIINRLNQHIAREINDELSEGGLSDQELSKRYDYIRRYFPGNFDHGRVPKLKKGIKDLHPKEMVKSLYNTRLKWFMDIYKLYQHYSRFEHYTNLSTLMLNNYVEFEFDRLVYSTFHVFHASYGILEQLKCNEKNIRKMLTLRDAICSIEPTMGFYDKEQS